MMECCTDIKVDTFEFKWVIKRFFLHMESASSIDSELKSSSFTGGNNDGTKWHLKCQIKFIDTKNYETSYYESRFFAVCDDFGEQQELWPRTTSYHAKNGIRSISICQQNVVTVEENSVQIYRYIIQSSNVRGKNISNVEFVFICKFEMIDNIIRLKKECAISEALKTNYGSYLSDLFANKKFSDVTFILGDEKLEAHKHILSTRSPVFAGMFESPMREQNENEVIVDDIEMNVFEEMLRYIYTNEAPNLKNMVMDLLYAAHKYCLDELKEKCGIFIWEKITIENAAEAYIFVYHHNIESLIELIEKFIKKHIFDVIKTAAYENIERNYPHVANIILRESLKQFQRHENK